MAKNPGMPILGYGLYHSKSCNLKLLLTIFALFLLLDYQSKGDPELSRRLELVRPIAADGSCGYVALCVSDYLTAREIPHEIYMFGIGKYENIHLMVRVGNAFIDKRGYNCLLTPQRLMPFRIVTREELRDMLTDTGKWRRSFQWKDTTEIREIIFH